MSKGYEPGTGGLVSHVARDAGAVTIAREALIVAAGPTANIVTALIAFAVAATHASSASQPGFWVDSATNAFGIQSLWVAIASLLPVSRGLRSDGQQLLRLRHPPADWRSNQMLGTLGALIKYNIRLRDRPGWLIQEVEKQIATSDGLEQVLRGQEVGKVLDAETVDVVRARSLLDALLEDYGDSEWLASCDAYFIAVWERDASRAASRMWRGQPHESDHAMMEAAAAAVMAASGDAKAVEAHLRTMNRELAKRTPFADPTFRDIARQIKTVLADTQRQQDA